MKDTDSSAFDVSRAELFEALSHPLRVRILQVLGERSQRFSELKHTLGIESSGHLSFHLEKLANLVKTTLDGDYELSDEGTDALRLFMTLNQVTESPSVHVALKDSLFNRKIVTQIGRDYLDGLDKPTGKILSIQLMEKAPIYWHNYTDIDIARAKETGEILHPYVLGELRLCWVIKFEKADRPGHFEVWIDANTNQIIGMRVTANC